VSHPATKSPFEFTGGSLCLDYVNTVNSRTSGQPEELLVSYDALLQWATEAGALPPKTAAHLRALAKESVGRAHSTMRDAIKLRDALYDLFLAISEGRSVPEAALAYLNRTLQSAAEHARLVRGSPNFRWEWIAPDEHLDSILWLVARSAADLLTSENVAFIGRCAADTCGWLFVDTTKNHRRRWCDMRSCGNRDKARRYYERTKGT
jgi:predicted RNA-binding Zn ribbon-like protein